MPTAPWMKGPLLLPADNVLDLREASNKRSIKKDNDVERSDRSLTDKVSGRRGKQVMKKIVQSVTKLERFHSFKEEAQEEFEFQVPLEEVVCKDGNVKYRGKMPWAKVERFVFRRMKKEKVKTAAELSLSESVLVRLRSDAVKMTQWVKVKKAGVTQAVVDEIKMTWKRNELAMVKFDLPLCRNMDRAREILEIKTRGLVVWSKKDSHVVYRGCDYESKPLQDLHSEHACVEESPEMFSMESSLLISEDDITSSHRADTIRISGEEDSFLTSMQRSLDLPSVSGTLFEREADRLLDELGPRYVDWWWPKPLPVDADMLPEVVSGFRTPFRRCPPHVRPKLTDDELTYLRKLARPLPTHFALGRNKKLQGLAAAIMKLWEKSLIVKIAVKWGIPNTNSEQMAWELKASFICEILDFQYAFGTLGLLEARHLEYFVLVLIAPHYYGAIWKCYLGMLN
ncbi:hypothetical protein IFM89_004838 [Coptis chinensis]|uniref:CRM domain-containing protein n=1 Tax=Coptis chinensis TaxID=261450 RepID=A0A835LH61_9MAGN|nr:hypothetical protein IFM89_004838 [Coptis chinensis]